MSHDSGHALPGVPSPLVLPGAVRAVAALLAAVGVAAFAWALTGGHASLASTTAST